MQFEQGSLFDKMAGVNKNRPTSATEQQKEEIYLNLAEEIIKNNYSSGDKEDIVEDLKKLSLNDSGFEKAKNLDSNGNALYRFDGDFIDFLENIDFEFEKKKRENVKLWFEANSIKPIFEVGQKLKIVSSLNFKLKKDEVVYVNRIKYDEAVYLIDHNPEKKGGVVIPFEDVESNCIITN